MTDVRSVSFITHILPALQTSCFSSVTQTHPPTLCLPDQNAMQYCTWFPEFRKKKYSCRLVYSRNTIIVLLIMARPWTGQPTNRNSIPNRGRWFSLLRSFETISGAHQGNGRRFTRRYRNRSVKLTITAKECRV